MIANFGPYPAGAAQSVRGPAPCSPIGMRAESMRGVQRRRGGGWLARRVGAALAPAVVVGMVVVSVVVTGPPAVPAPPAVTPAAGAQIAPLPRIAPGPGRTLVDTSTGEQFRPRGSNYVRLAPMPSNPGGISYAANGATFRGEYAVGGSLMYRLNTQTPMALSVGASFAGNKNNGARIGISGEF